MSQNDNTQHDNDNDIDVKTTDKGFVASEEFPACPACGHQGSPVVSNLDGLDGLHCRECGRILDHASTATKAIPESDRQYAVIGDRAWGTGSTEDEALENMRKHLPKDPFPVYTVYVSNKDIIVSKGGAVKTEGGEKAILHKVAKRRLRAD